MLCLNWATQQTFYGARAPQRPRLRRGRGEMDGTRMGSRSSTRHGPATAFSGPVRRWRKAWAPVTSSSNHATSPSSRVLLYKWVPVTPVTREDTAEDQVFRAPRYLPVSVVLAQRKESKQAADEMDAAAASSDSDKEVSNSEKDNSGDGVTVDSEDEASEDKNGGPVDIDEGQGDRMVTDEENTGQVIEGERQEDVSTSDTAVEV